MDGPPAESDFYADAGSVVYGKSRYSIPMLSTAELAATLKRLAPRDEDYPTRFVEGVLSAGAQGPVSDVHLTPTAQGLELRWRCDGVLEAIGLFSPGEAADV